MLEKDTHARPFFEPDNTQRRAPFNRNPCDGAVVQVLSERPVAQMTRFHPARKGSVYHLGVDGGVRTGKRDRMHLYTCDRLSQENQHRSPRRQCRAARLKQTLGDIFDYRLHSIAIAEPPTLRNGGKEIRG